LVKLGSRRPVLIANFKPREPNGFDSRRSSAVVGFSLAGRKLARSGEFSFWTKPFGRFRMTVLEMPHRGAKSHGLRYGGYALKGLSEDFRLSDNRQRLERRVLRHGKPRPPWRPKHLLRQAIDRFRRLSARLLDTLDDRDGPPGVLRAVMPARERSVIALTKAL